MYKDATQRCFKKIPDAGNREKLEKTCDFAIFFRQRLVLHFLRSTAF